MKQLLLIVTLVLGAGTFSFAQKVITKKVDMQGKKAELKFDFAENIHIEAWKNNTIELEVTVNIEDNRYNDYYTLDVGEESGKVVMAEKVDFKAIQKARGNKDEDHFETTINYKLKMPEDLAFSLKTISGKVELIGAKGKMEVNSISGFIDYSIPVTHKAHIDLSTISGDVYSDLKFDTTKKEEMSWVGTKRELSFNGGTLPIELKTVSGDIYLRKL